MNKRALFSLTAAFTLAVAAPGMAASGKVKAQPGVYDPGATGIVVADWQGGVGLPDLGANGNQGLVLQKDGPTATNAAARADITGVAGLPASGFGFDIQGYCGAGSPRFNVQASDGFHFLGCADGTVTPAGTPGWSHVSFDNATQAYPPIAAGATIESVQLVADEEGQSIVDNIALGGVTIGKAGNQ